MNGNLISHCITDLGFHPYNILTQDDRKHGNFNTLDSGTLHLEHYI